MSFDPRQQALAHARDETFAPTMATVYVGDQLDKLMDVLGLLLAPQPPKEIVVDTDDPRDLRARAQLALDTLSEISDVSFSFAITEGYKLTIIGACG